MSWRSAALVCTIAAAVCNTSYAQESVESGLETTLSSGQAGSTTPPRVRRRLQQLRGINQRVIYPVIFLVDGLQYETYPGALAFEPDARVGLGQDSTTQDGAAPDTTALDQTVPFAVVQNQSNENRNANTGVADSVARTSDARAVQAELNSLRTALLRANQNTASSIALRDAEILALNRRLSELESDVDLLLATRGSAAAAAAVAAADIPPDTVVVIRRDTVAQIVPGISRVDTVVVREPAAPPTVVQIERALLDEGLFQTVDVLFEFGQSTLLPTSRRILESIGNVLRNNPDIAIEVGGHTDDVGPAEYNQSLSVRRADAVRTYLVETAGLAAERITARGFGETSPVAENVSPTGRALNRRVDFRVVNRE